MMPELLTTAVVIIAFVAAVSLIEHRVKSKGSLFAGAATPRIRLLAFLLGFVFAAFFLGELNSSDVVHLLFPIVAIALIAYRLGAGAILGNLQGKSAIAVSIVPEPMFPLNRIGRLLFILGIGGALGAVVIYVVMQAVVHPDNPVSLILIIGIILLVAVARLRRWFGLILKRNDRPFEPIDLQSNTMIHADRVKTVSNSVESGATDSVEIKGDVVGRSNMGLGEPDKAAQVRIGGTGGVSLRAASISIGGDVVGDSKIVNSKSLGDQPISCPNCGRSYLPSKNNFACPNCGSATPKEFLNHSA